MPLAVGPDLTDPAVVEREIQRLIDCQALDHAKINPGFFAEQMERLKADLERARVAQECKALMREFKAEDAKLDSDLQRAKSALEETFKRALGPERYAELLKKRALRKGSPREPEEIIAEFTAVLDKAKAEAAAIRKKHEESRKAVVLAKREDAKLEREADKLRSDLRYAAVAKKDLCWAKIPPAERCKLAKLEADIRDRLWKIEARLKSRSKLREEASKHRQAMLERGVTFDRMT